MPSLSQWHLVVQQMRHFTCSLLLTQLTWTWRLKTSTISKNVCLIWQTWNLLDNTSSKTFTTSVVCQPLWNTFLRMVSFTVIVSHVLVRLLQKTWRPSMIWHQVKKSLCRLKILNVLMVHWLSWKVTWLQKVRLPKYQGLKFVTSLVLLKYLTQKKMPSKQFFLMKSLMAT